VPARPAAGLRAAALWVVEPRRIRYGLSLGTYLLGLNPDSYGHTEQRDLRRTDDYTNLKHKHVNHNVHTIVAKDKSTI
jgi:hypothetical protein